MKRLKIDSARHASYRSFEKLYASSFPIFEQRTQTQQDAAFGCERYNLTGYEDNGVFIGFISYWEFDDYIYIEHFAVDTDSRGKGYGSKILQSFVEATDKIVLLEIDPVTDEISEARLRFYLKCGFKENPYRHLHPAYRNEYRAHRLTVLTTPRQITEREYRIFDRDLRRTVMGKNGKYPPIP